MNKQGCFRCSTSLLRVQLKAELLGEAPADDSSCWAKHFVSLDKETKRGDLVQIVAEYISSEVIDGMRSHLCKIDERVVTWMMIWDFLRRHQFPRFSRDLALLIADAIYTCSDDRNKDEMVMVVDVILWHREDLIFAEQVAKEVVETSEEWEFCSSLFHQCEVVFFESVKHSDGLRPGYERKKVGRRVKRVIVVKADKDFKLRRALGYFE